jgi:hypothetical protein
LFSALILRRGAIGGAIVRVDCALGARIWRLIALDCARRNRLINRALSLQVVRGCARRDGDDCSRGVGLWLG